MFPPHDFHESRLQLKGDLPWEPWLHCCVWFGVIGALIWGDRDIIPPVDRLDWAWAIFGLMSPPIGFASVWMLAYSPGRRRYVAMWMRMLANGGLAACIILYEVERYFENWRRMTLDIGVNIPNLVFVFCAWYMSVLVVRDIKLVVAVERLAGVIHGDAIHLAAGESAERVDDAN